MEQQINLNSLTVEQLKAIGYDLILRQQTLSQDIALVQQVLNSKEQIENKKTKEE